MVTPIKSHDPLITWSCKIMWYIKNIESPLSKYLWSGWWNNAIAPNHKVTWPFNHVVLGGYLTNYLRYISTYRRSTDTKLGEEVTYCERFSILKSHDLLITWQLEVTLQIEKIVSPLSQDLWPLNLTECWLQGGSGERKRLSPHQLYLFLLL